MLLTRGICLAGPSNPDYGKLACSGAVKDAGASTLAGASILLLPCDSIILHSSHYTTVSGIMRMKGDSGNTICIDKEVFLRYSHLLKTLRKYIAECQFSI